MEFLNSWLLNTAQVANIFFSLLILVFASAGGMFNVLILIDIYLDKHSTEKSLGHAAFIVFNTFVFSSLLRILKHYGDKDSPFFLLKLGSINFDFPILGNSNFVEGLLFLGIIIFIVIALIRRPTFNILKEALKYGMERSSPIIVTLSYSLMVSFLSEIIINKIH